MMLTLKIDLYENMVTELELIELEMPNGDTHYCTEDSCNCPAAKYGNICRHRLFIFAMGGFEELRKLILSERRKAAKLATSTASDPKGTDPK